MSSQVFARFAITVLFFVTHTLNYRTRPALFQSDLSLIRSWYLDGCQYTGI